MWNVSANLLNRAKDLTSNLASKAVVGVNMLLEDPPSEDEDEGEEDNVELDKQHALPLTVCKPAR
jgi:hypothetical protein